MSAEKKLVEHFAGEALRKHQQWRVQFEGFIRYAVPVDNGFVDLGALEWNILCLRNYAVRHHGDL